MSMLNIGPDHDIPGDLDGGPEAMVNSSAALQRSNSLLSLAFGFASGIAGMILYLMAYFKRLAFTNTILEPYFNELYPALLIVFFAGFVFGSVASLTYNLLIVRRAQILGLSRDDI